MRDAITNLRTRILIPLTIALGILLSAFILNVYYTKDKGILENVGKALESGRELYEKEMKSGADYMLLEIKTLSVDPEIQAAWLAKDREALQQAASPILADLKSKYRITHLYFHDDQKINFLRVHSPEKYGDDLGCLDVPDIEKSDQLASSIELRPSGRLILRVVHPWQINGKLVGYIEMAEDIDHIIEKIHAVLGTEMYVTIYKNHLERKQWEAGRQKLGLEADWNQFPSFVILNKTIEVPEALGKFLAPENHEGMQMANNLELSIGDRLYRVGLIPIYDANMDEIGDIAMLYDVTKQILTASNSILAVGVICTIIGTGLFLFFFVILGRVERELDKHRLHLEELVKERAAEIITTNEQLTLEITERKQAENELRKSEHELKTRNQIANIFLAVTGEKMYPEVLQVILEAMQSKYGLFGYIDQNGDLVFPSMTGETWDKCQMPDKNIVFPREKWGGIWGKALIEKRTLYANNPFHVPKGHIPITNTLVVPIIYHDELIGMIQVGNKSTEYDKEDQALLETIAGRISPVLHARLHRDIKDRERTLAENKLNRTIVELGRSNAELQLFVNMASHDLQEPLRMVTSYLQLLARRYKGRLDKDADDFIDYAVDGATRMYALINALLAYSRAGSNGKPLETIDSKAVLSQAIDSLQTVIEESGAVITYNRLPIIKMDPLQLSQLFQNLIANAIKFRNEKPPRIHVSAKQKRKECLFSICDNGIGIDPQYAERIFTIFQRLHKKTDYPGTGIGLAICKKIVERHGGQIWVESKPRKGATFYFNIPTTGGN